MANRVQAALHADAVHIAEDADMALSTELSKALFPLFAMEELVKHLHVFDDLPQRIGGTSNVTIEHGVVFQNASNFRNVSGICDDPRYTKPYSRIASSVKSNANLSKVLLNIELAPAGVVCLVYPMTNSEDLGNGKFLDSGAAIGLDLLNDPARGYYTRESIKARRVTIQGPLRVIQDNSSVVDKALVVRNPIFIDGYKSSIGGELYPFWGFAVVLLNWEELMKRSQLFRFFDAGNMELCLSRTDVFMNFTTNKESQEVNLSRKLLFYVYWPPGSFSCLPFLPMSPLRGLAVCYRWR